MKQKILILDDEASVVSTLAIMLRNAIKDIAPATFTDPLEALKSFMSEPDSFAIIITDLYMPVMGGIDFCKKIRETSDNIPIIILTGYGETSSMEEAARLNISDFIEKPIRLDSFIEVIKKAIEHSASLKTQAHVSVVARFKQQFMNQVELLLSGKTPFGYTSAGFIINVLEQQGVASSTIQSFKQAALLMAEETSYLEAKTIVERLEKTRKERLQQLSDWYRVNK
jgi:FixJ family two-component response regulator